jgi:hypothetical protein
MKFGVDCAIHDYLEITIFNFVLSVITASHFLELVKWDDDDDAIPHANS